MLLQELMNRYVGIFIAESIEETSFSVDALTCADPVREAAEAVRI